LICVVFSNHKFSNQKVLNSPQSKKEFKKVKKIQYLMYFFKIINVYMK